MTLQPARGVLPAVRLFRPGSPEALLLLREAWPLAVGADLARRTEVHSADGSILRVAVPDARWRKVLHRMRFDILSRLRAVAGGLVPRQLGFVEQARMEVRAPATGDPAREPAPPPACPASLMAAAEAIEDPELRRHFVESAARYLSRFSKVTLSGDEHA